MACSIKINHQSCCEKTINNIIDERKDQLKTATILFYYQTVPESDYLTKLHKNLSPARVLIVTREFNKAWDDTLEQLRTYKKRVVGREIDLSIILHDIEIFIKNEKTNYETVKRNFNVKLSMIDEEKQRDIVEKIEELDVLFGSYLEDLENKKKIIMEAEDYMPLVIEEINSNMDWYYKQKRQAEQKFKEKIDCMIGDLINSSIVKTYKAGKNITLTILKLEEKLRQKKIAMGGVDTDLDDELSGEISKLQQERSSLDYQAATLVDLENTFQRLVKEQNEIFETMKRLEEEFDKQVQDIMTDDCLSEDEKQLKIKELRCKHEAEISELQEREEKIHGKIERIRHEILARHDGFDIELLEKLGMKDKGSCETLKSTDPNFKLYHFDQYGRYFINENGLKIYKSDCSSKAYIMDENGNLLEIKMEGSQVLFVSDSDYLKYHVGDVLKKGMAQVFLYQPADPVAYLANFIIKYRKNVIAEEERKRDLDDLLLREERTC